MTALPFVCPIVVLRIRQPMQRRKDLGTMKADSFGEIFLWNREMDCLIRVLQRMESSGMLCKHEMKVYKVQLEEARAGLNVDFAGRIATSERGDQSRLKR